MELTDMRYSGERKSGGNDGVVALAVVVTEAETEGLSSTSGGVAIFPAKYFLGDRRVPSGEQGREDDSLGAGVAGADFESWKGGNVILCTFKIIN